MLIAWKEYISESENNDDKTYINGTKITVRHIMDLMAAGKSIDDMVRNLEGIDYEHIFACLEYSRQKVGK